MVTAISTSALVPPFNRETAAAKVRAGENLWNTRDPERVALGYTSDGRWRNRSIFVQGRERIVAYGNENWEFDADGLMITRHASINDVAIACTDRLFHWDSGGFRPDDHPDLSGMGL